jgi:hypothetical protein
VDQNIRNSKRTVVSVVALVLALAIPTAGFALLIAGTPHRLVDRAVHALMEQRERLERAKAAEAKPAAPMVFEGETITLEEADAASQRELEVAESFGTDCVPPAGCAVEFDNEEVGVIAARTTDDGVLARR